MATLRLFPNQTATLRQAPAASRGGWRGVWGIASGEPDRLGILAGVTLVLATLLATTVTLGFLILFS